VLETGTGNKTGNKLSETQTNSDAETAAESGLLSLSDTRSLRLGAGRSQVQILSPRSKSPANTGFLFGQDRRGLKEIVPRFVPTRVDRTLFRNPKTRLAGDLWKSTG
jgi:hypothetical protein